MTVRVRVVRELAGAGRTGRHVEHDARSRLHAVDASAPIRTHAWKRHAPILDQGSIGRCTGNAMAGALGTDPLVDPTLPIDQTLADLLYRLATRLDDIDGSYPEQDTGSSGLAVAKAAKRMGLIDAYRHAFSLHAVLSWLSNRGPMILGTNWHEGMDRPDSSGRVELAGDVRGGHEYEAIAVDAERQLVRCANSWSVAWGDRGYFVLTFDQLGALLAEDGDALAPLRR